MTARDELRSWYTSPMWGNKVDHMSDEKVEEVLARLKRNREYYKGKTDGGHD